MIMRLANAAHAQQKQNLINDETGFKRNALQSPTSLVTTDITPVLSNDLAA